MDFHLLTLALQKDVSNLDYDQALEMVEEWADGFRAAFNSASKANSRYKNKQDRSIEATELVSQAIIIRVMKFALTPNGRLIVKNGEKY